MTKPGEDQPLIDLPDVPTDIDHLMSLNPLNLTPAAREAYLNGVIGYHRNLRVAKEAGVKVPKRGKGKPEGSVAPKIDLLALGIKPAAPKITRRV
jgi:hypothetical protein